MRSVDFSSISSRYAYPALFSSAFLSSAPESMILTSVPTILSLSSAIILTRRSSFSISDSLPTSRDSMGPSRSNRNPHTPSSPFPRRLEGILASHSPAPRPCYSLLSKSPDDRQRHGRAYKRDDEDKQYPLKISYPGSKQLVLILQRGLKTL